MATPDDAAGKSVAELVVLPTPESTPPKLRCARCNNIVQDAFRLPCCDQNICEPCKNTLPSSCPVCSHSPLSPDQCNPNKALRLTLKAFLKNEARKEEKRREEEQRQRIEKQGVTEPSLKKDISTPNQTAQSHEVEATNASHIEPKADRVPLEPTSVREDAVVVPAAVSPVEATLEVESVGSPHSETSSIEITLEYAGDDPERPFGRANSRSNPADSTLLADQQRRFLQSGSDQIARTITPKPSAVDAQTQQANGEPQAFGHPFMGDAGNWHTGGAFNHMFNMGIGLNTANMSSAMMQNQQNMMNMAGMSMDHVQMMMSQGMLAGAAGMAMPGMMGMNGVFGQPFNGWNVGMNLYAQNAAYQQQSGYESHNQWGQTNGMQRNNHAPQIRSRGQGYQRGQQNFAGHSHANMPQAPNARQGAQQDVFLQQGSQQNGYQHEKNAATNEQKGHVMLETANVNGEHEAQDIEAASHKHTGAPRHSSRNERVHEDGQDTEHGTTKLDSVHEEGGADRKHAATSSEQDTAVNALVLPGVSQLPTQAVQIPTGPAAQFVHTGSSTRIGSHASSFTKDLQAQPAGGGPGRVFLGANGSADTITDVTPHASKPGVAGAPTGPRAMREGKANVGLRGRGGVHVSGPPMPLASSVNAVVAPSTSSASHEPRNRGRHDGSHSPDISTPPHKHRPARSPALADDEEFESGKDRRLRHSHRRFRDSTSEKPTRSAMKRSDEKENEEKHQSSRHHREGSRERRHRRHRSRSHSPPTEDRHKRRRKSKRDVQNVDEDDDLVRSHEHRRQGDRNRQEPRKATGQNQPQRKDTRDATPERLEFKILNRASKSELDIQKDIVRRENPNIDVYSLEREASARERLAREAQRRQSVIAVPKGMSNDRKRAHMAGESYTGSGATAHNSSGQKARLGSGRASRRSQGRLAPDGENDEARLVRIELEREMR